MLYLKQTILKHFYEKHKNYFKKRLKLFQFYSRVVFFFTLQYILSVFLNTNSSFLSNIIIHFEMCCIEHFFVICRIFYFAVLRITFWSSIAVCYIYDLKEVSPMTSLPFWYFFKFFVCSSFSRCFVTFFHYRCPLYSFCCFYFNPCFIYNLLIFLFSSRPVSISFILILICTWLLLVHFFVYEHF